MSKVLGLGMFYGLNDGQCGWSSGGKASGAGDRAYRVLEAVGAMVGGFTPAPLWLGKWATECAQLSPLLGIVVSGRELSDPIREAPWGLGKPSHSQDRLVQAARLDYLPGMSWKDQPTPQPLWDHLRPLLQP